MDLLKLQIQVGCEPLWGMRTLTWVLCTSRQDASLLSHSLLSILASAERNGDGYPPGAFEDSMQLQAMLHCGWGQGWTGEVSDAWLQFRPGPVTQP